MLRAVTAGRARPGHRRRRDARGARLRRRAPRPPRLPRPWSRHDIAFVASALGLAVLALGAGIGGWAPFDAVPADRGRPIAAPLVLAAALAGLRAGAVRSTAGGSSDERARARRASATPIPARRAPALRDVSLTRRAGRVRAAGRAARARASRRCCAPPPAWCPHFHGGTFAGTRALRRARHARARAGRARRRRRHAVPGPGDAGGDGHGPRGARVPAREPRLGRRRGRARGGGGGARARPRRPARPRRRTSSPAASCSASRSAPRWPGARGCCCSTSRPRSSTRSRATSCSACCGGSTRSGGRRSCSPSTGSSAACPPPTA